MSFHKEYHPDEVDLVIGGRVISGIESDIEVASPDRVSLKEDKEGNSVWCVQKLKSADLTFELMFGAPDLQVLQDYVNLDKTTGNGAFSILIRNNRGNDLITARSARIVTDPSARFGATEAQTQPVNIKCAGVKIGRGAADDTEV